MSLSDDQGPVSDSISTPSDIPLRIKSTLGEEIARLTSDRLVAGSQNIYREIVSRVELKTIDLVMKHCGGVQLRASDGLGLSRVTLRQRLAELKRLTESPQ